MGQRLCADCIQLTCRGVFGCHTALVLRRLRRLCHYQYHCSPTFVITSATVANPESHVQALLGEPSFVCVRGLPAVLHLLMDGR